MFEGYGLLCLRYKFNGECFDYHENVCSSCVVQLIDSERDESGVLLKEKLDG